MKHDLSCSLLFRITLLSSFFHFACHWHCMSPHFILIQWVKNTQYCQSTLKADTTSLSVSTCLFFLCVCVCLATVFSSVALHMSVIARPGITTPAMETCTQTSGTVDLWLSFQAAISDVSGGKSKVIICQWVSTLRTISFPDLCTTSICKAGFLSIKLHEYKYFLAVKPWNETWFVL